MRPSMRLRKAGQTPVTGVGTAGPTPVSLPLDFLGDASRRLGWTALFYASCFTLAYFVPTFLFLGEVRGGLGRALTSPNSIVAYICIALSLVVFRLSRSVSIDPRRLLDIGLIYEVVGAFGISMAEFWGIFPDATEAEIKRHFAGIPWECVWIIFFPLVAPNTHRKVLLASLGAASTGLLVVSMSRAFGLTNPEISMNFFVRYFLFSTYLCAFLALVSSVVIHGIGKRLQRAQEIGSYRLVDRLGTGGMGEVWRASHRMLARPAAIKLIRPEVLGADEITRREATHRFEREAQATAALQSYHTIDLYDFGVSDDGSFYYVMELLDGFNLDTLVKRFGPVSAGRSVRLLRQVCHSLAEAHECGMIHRDIKPANIYACRLGLDCDFVKVLDFGLVKSSRETQRGSTQLSVEGLAAGTPAFMAPEMAMGRRAVDGRVDIYSLGCVAYWLLTGQLVFEGDTPMATVLQHIQTQPVPPSQRTEIPIPALLERTILSCLEKDPGERPQSVRELDALLAQCEDEEVWNREKAAEWWNLHMPRKALAVEKGAGGDEIHKHIVKQFDPGARPPSVQ